MKIPLFDIAAQNRSLGADLDDILRAAIDSGQLIGGEAVSGFERAFGEYLGAGHIVSCGCGTDALEIALEALGLGEGDEVIVPAMTWFATAEAAARIGCTPVFADVIEGEWTLDPVSVERALTPRTRAIVPVHLYGRPARMDALMELAQRHDLFVIEDCAQAHGAMIGEQKLGTIGDAAIFSFFPTKNLGALGDGGAMAFANEEIAHRARLIASHGQEERHRHVLIGRNSRLDALHAAVLSLKLPRLDGWIAAKEQLAATYRDAFANLPLQCPTPFGNGRHGWHLFALVCDRRDALGAHLRESGIQTGVHYPASLPEQPAFADAKPRNYPVAYDLARTQLSLPLYPELSREQIDHVIASVRSFFA